MSIKASFVLCEKFGIFFVIKLYQEHLKIGIFLLRRKCGFICGFGGHGGAE